MSRQRRILPLITVLALSAAVGAAQDRYLPEKLDLTGDIATPRLESALHHPLPEQYIWAPGAGDEDSAKTLYFRDTFKLDAAPGSATLYIAGPDHVRAYLNGQLQANAQRDPRSRLRPMVLSLPVAGLLRAGSNTLAIEVSGGDRLVVKLVPRIPEVEARALVMSGPDWKYSSSGDPHWEQPAYNDANWKSVRALGAIESNIEFFQWNNDAGMYRWPGYDGISPFLAHLPAPVASVLYAFQGLGRLENLGAIAPVSKEAAAGGREAGDRDQSHADFTVTLPPNGSPKEEYPYIVLDLGRESDGRLEVVSDSAAPMKLAVQYGESLQEAENQPYLDADELDVPPHATVHGPKSAFRYAVVRFTGGTSPLGLKAVRLDSVYYPVKYQGSFESSDPLLNRIWQVGAYTSHLSMQDDIWDAPKRDRGRWMGDLDVSGRVIDTVFADQFLMQDTMDRLIKEAGDPVHGDVNSIPGYSAFWVMGQADYYRHSGNHEYLKSITEPLSHLLEYMESELDDRKLFVNSKKAWPFVDWSPDLNEDTAESRRATHLEFAKAFAEGTWLLQEAGADPEDIAKFTLDSQQLKFAAQNFLLDPAANTFGPRWETNAMAIFSGVADDKQTADIWDKVLSQPRHFMITPYYNFYVITAMAEAGHRREALDWIREFWGGMMSAGATSFWEAYDPSWPKANFHESLQADNGQGYFVSLCHGWSSGPTAWLTEQILGIQPQAAGFSQVSIRPDLAGLEWARGAEPTPHGPIKVDLRGRGGAIETTLDLPDGVTADVSIPAPKGATAVEVNGEGVTAASAENGTRLMVEIAKGGHYSLRAK